MLKIKRLPDAELEIMNALWDADAPLTAAELETALPGPPRARTTLLTLLARLEEKGWVKSGKDGNRNTYTPAITQRAYNVWSMRERLDTLFGNDLAAAVRALVSESGCGQSELEQAMKVLEEKHLEAEEYDLYDPYG